MIRNRSIRIAAAVLVLGAFAGAARPAAAQVTDARIRELIKQATDPATRLQTPSPAQPGTASDPRQTVPLTLDDAVKFALDRNLDIAVQRLNPEINDIAYASIKSVYHPNLTSTVASQAQTSPSTSTIAGGTTGAPTCWLPESVLVAGFVVDCVETTDVSEGW